MGKIILLLLLVLCSLPLSSQIPERFNYQVVLRDAQGKIRSNTDVVISFHIIQGLPTGIPVYAEYHSTRTDAFGIICLEIGGGIVTTGSFNTISWGIGPYYLKIQVDGVEYGIIQFLSVPYALHSKSVTGRVDADNNAIINVAKPVNDNDAANKSYIDELARQMGFIPPNEDGTITDIDGNVYETIKIGEQIWFKENLKTTKFNDGVSIPNVTDFLVWREQKAIPMFAWYNNDISNKAIYGALYNWPAVTTLRLCPLGWHVATNSEWSALANYLGGTPVAGGKLKEVGVEHWISPNNGATDDYGFRAVPSGHMYGGFFPPFAGIGYVTIWWTMTEGEDGTIVRRITNENTSLDSLQVVGPREFSVRCVKDK